MLDNIRTPPYCKQSELLEVELLDAFAQIEALLRCGAKCNAMRCVFADCPIPSLTPKGWPQLALFGVSSLT